MGLIAGLIKASVVYFFHSKATFSIPYSFYALMALIEIVINGGFTTAVILWCVFKVAIVLSVTKWLDDKIEPLLKILQMEEKSATVVPTLVYAVLEILL